MSFGSVAINSSEPPGTALMAEIVLKTSIRAVLLHDLLLTM